MLYASKFLMALAILGTASAQVFTPGNCDKNIETAQNFNRTRHIGKWYQIKRTFNFIEEAIKCYKIDCRLLEGKSFSMEGSFVLRNTDNKFHSKPFTLVAESEESPEKMILTPGYISDSQPLYILDTDYVNYTVGYTCLDSYQGKLEFAWILGRMPTLDVKIVEIAVNALRKRNITLDLITEEQDCN